MARRWEMVLNVWYLLEFDVAGHKVEALVWVERAGGHGGTVYDDYFISGFLVPRQGLDHGGPMVYGGCTLSWKPLAEVLNCISQAALETFCKLVHQGMCEHAGTYYMWWYIGGLCCLRDEWCLPGVVPGGKSGLRSNWLWNQSCDLYLDMVPETPNCRRWTNKPASRPQVMPGLTPGWDVCFYCSSRQLSSSSPH